MIHDKKENILRTRIGKEDRSTRIVPAPLPFVQNESRMSCECNRDPQQGEILTMKCMICGRVFHWTYLQGCSIDSTIIPITSRSYGEDVEGKIVPVLNLLSSAPQRRTGEWLYIYIHPRFLTSALVRGEWSASRPGCFTAGERARRYSLDKKFGGHRADLNDKEKWKILTLLELELRPFGRPARMQSLYWPNHVRFLNLLCSLLS
jgi:hypothetical protein